MKYIIWLLFLTNGRLNRKGFWLVVGPLLLLSYSVTFTNAESTEALNTVTGVNAVFLLVQILLSFWILLALVIKRLHDINQSGFWALLLLLPAVNFFIFIGIGLINGTDGPNKFGNYRFLEANET